ncbi:MAG: UDP-N-acetylmuramate dehydrogenase [Candidatus Omnitrophica bacterium]|nr:UDP-N-acetylmuramate dehydrogenase [Candidatus Omnitrophota bacterium]
MHWPKSLNNKINFSAKLSDYTTFKIGGCAKYFLKAGNLSQLLDALALAKNKFIRVFILGAGSNILASDTGVNGLVIKLSGADFTKLSVQGRFIDAGSAMKLNQLVLRTKDSGLSGLEFLAGIPGTLGGALMGNAGAWGRSIGELVEEVQVLDYNGKVRRLKKQQLKFSYRKSNLQKYIILSARLRLSIAKKETIILKIKQYLKQRSKTQSNNLPNAGCIFKNPKGLAAGKLIEECGLKNKRRGQAIISPVHANFILNTAQAHSEDVLALMDLMRREVKKKFKVMLKPEINIWK